VKKKLALLLAFVLAFSFMPVTLMADDDDNGYDNDYYGEDYNGDDYYDEYDDEDYDDEDENGDEYADDEDEYVNGYEDAEEDVDGYEADEDLNGDEAYEDENGYDVEEDEEDYTFAVPVSDELDEEDLEPIVGADTSEAPEAVTLVFTIDSTTFTRNGVPQQLDVAPFIAGGRTMLPFAALATAIDATHAWNAETRSVTFYRAGVDLEIFIGQELPNNMGTADIVGGRTFVPVAFVTSQLGGTTQWDGQARTVTVNF